MHESPGDSVDVALLMLVPEKRHNRQIAVLAALLAPIA